MTGADAASASGVAIMGAFCRALGRRRDVSLDDEFDSRDEDVEDSEGILLSLSCIVGLAILSGIRGSNVFSGMAFVRDVSNVIVVSSSCKNIIVKSRDSSWNFDGVRAVSRNEIDN